VSGPFQPLVDFTEADDEAHADDALATQAPADATAEASDTRPSNK